MRIAKFEGYSGASSFVAVVAARRSRQPFGAYGLAATDPAIEETIRNQVAVMQQVQRALWDAYSSWSSGKFWSGVLFPASALLRIGKFDWRYAVDSWQSSVDTWWNETMTNTVRSNPDRLADWTRMGQGLIEWAKRIARDMGDDDLGATFSQFLDSFSYVVKTAVAKGVDLSLSLLPGWLPWAAGGALLLFLVVKFK